MNALDVSNYTGNITVAQARSAAAQGVSRAIVGLQYPAPPYPRGQAQQQLVSWLAAGVEVEVYFQSTPVAVSWTYVGDFASRIRRPWASVEPGGYETVEAIRDALSEIDALGIGRCGIYTSAWALSVLGLDLSEFADRDLWWAGYNGQQDLEMRPFGGFTKCVMHQYAGDTEFAGIKPVDLNWYELGANTPTTSESAQMPQTEDEMPLQLESLTDQAEAIRKVKEVAEAVGPDEGEWFRVVGGYTPKPGRTAYLVEVVE